MPFTNLSGVDYDAKEVLLISDNNCFLNKNTDVEAISNYPISNQRNLNIDEFLNNHKRPMCLHYNYVIIVGNYVDMVFPKISYYFALNNFRLDIIVDKDYKLENNTYLLNLMNDPNVKTTFNDNGDFLVVNFRR